MARAAIKTYGLTKCYGDVPGVLGLDLEVSRGEVFGFLGPNGSGKTTTIRLLLDLIRPTSGHAEVLGLDAHTHAHELRRLVGNLPGEFWTYPQLTVNAFFRLCSGGRPAGMTRAMALAERFRLDTTRRIGALSAGNRQKCGLVQSFMHDPELVILDEPTSGLDPLVREEFYSLVGEERERGKTIFCSSHVLSDVERICDGVGIVRDGRLIAVEAVAALKRHKRRRMEVSFATPVDPAEIELPADGGVEVTRSGDCGLVLSIPEGSVGGVIKALAKLPVKDLVFAEATLEEAFISLYSATPGPAPESPCAPGGGPAREAA